MMAFIHSDEVTNHPSKRTIRRRYSLVCMCTVVFASEPSTLCAQTSNDPVQQAQVDSGGDQETEDEIGNGGQQTPSGEILSPPIAITGIEAVRELSPEQVGRLGTDQLARLSTEQVRSLSAEQLEGLSTQQLNSLTREQVRTLTPEQVRSLSSEQLREWRAASNLTISQYSELSQEQQEALPTDTMRVLERRAALHPGVRFVGDAYAQLVATAGDLDAGSAFGAGVSVQTLDTRATISVRGGIRPSILNTATEFGVSILEPQTQRVAFSFLGSYWPRRAEIPSARLVTGPYWYIHISSCRWQILLGAEEVADPPTDPNTDTPIDALATTFALAAGYEARFLMQQGDNLIEIAGHVAATLRAVAIEADADRRLNSMLMEGETDYKDLFLERSIESNTNVYGGIDIGIELRIRELIIVADLRMVFGCRVAGLCGFNFVPTISLSTGPTLVDLSNRI